MKKQCFKCNLIKPVQEFYAHPQMADGHLGKCKECTKEESRLFRLNNYEKLSLREKIKHQKTKHRDRLRDREYLKRYRKKNPIKVKAHRAVSLGIAKGKIVKPKCCEICGSERHPLHSHHNDYLKPLTVVWLCARCHQRLHPRQKKLTTEAVMTSQPASGKVRGISPAP